MALPKERSRGGTALMHTPVAGAEPRAAVALGDTEALEALLAAGGDVERETGRGSLLGVAAGAGDADMVRFLVARGAAVDRAGRASDRHARTRR